MSMSTASYDSEHHDGAPDYGACRRPTPPVRRGDIFYADLSPVIGSEQGGLRPVLIVQNDVGNRYSPTVIAAAITSRMGTLIFMPTVSGLPRTRSSCWNRSVHWINAVCGRRWGIWTRRSWRR